MKSMIGFLSDLPEKRVKDPHDLLLGFDSGNGITFEDARHQILVMGATGSGKTAGVMLPSLSRLIKAGHCGVVIDIKGNLRDQARVFARHCGRANDLVEFGSALSATPLNLLCGMPMAAVRDMLQTLTMANFQHASQNKDWHMKGVFQAADCVQLLRYLAVLDAAFEPTLYMVAVMANDCTLSAALFRLFKNAVFEQDNKEQRMFAQRIESSEFHILMFDEKKIEKSGRYLEQITWNMQGIRMALTAYLETPGIARGFAAQGAPGLDMRALLEHNKIVLLRFEPDTGPVGASLARMILQEYYKAVYTIGLSLPEGKYSFACLDEFQDFADLGADRFSDTNFVAQAREFRAIYLASTQSMAALANRSNSFAAVNSFVSNCNTRVVFYSDDPYTQNMASQYDMCMPLHTLRAGQAFVVQYDTERRRHFYGVETLQQAYETTREILRQAECSGSGDDVPAAGAETVPSLVELLEQGEARHTAAMEEKKRAEKMQERKSKEAASSSFENDVFCADSGKMPGKYHGLNEDEGEQESKKGIESQNGAERLLKIYPQLFPEDAQEVYLGMPAGWLPYVEKVFQAFVESGLKLTISTMAERGGALVVSAKEPGKRLGLHYPQPNEQIMNFLLRGTRGLCALCGLPAAQPQQRPKNVWWDNDESNLSICDGCLSKFGLLPPETPEAGMEANTIPLSKEG